MSAAFGLQHLGTVASTMAEARSQALAGAPSGLCLVAEVQTQGRGRRGNTWFSDPGAICMTAILRVPSARPPQTLSFAVGLAVLDALAAAGCQGLRLKWPNDVVLGSNPVRKISGILMEAEGLGGPEAVVLAGIGINIRPPAEVDVPAELLHRYLGAQELAATTSSRAVLERLVPALQHRFEQWLSQGEAATLRDWRPHDAVLGRRIAALGPAGPVQGLAQGIDAQGALTVQTAAGEVYITAGEVQFLDL